MKRVMTLLLCLLWSSNLWATNIRPSDQVTIPTRTIYNDGNLGTPDSVRIQVFRNGAEQSDAWYNNADAEAAAIDGWLIFHDQLSDIDGAGGDGHYAILGRAYDLDSTLYTPWVYSFTVGPWTAIDLIEDSIQSQDDWVAKEATLAYFDTLIYDGPRGPGVYLDSAASNTNTVIGADGTAKNPVSTIAAAKTIATALGYKRYYFINASTFNSAANDIPSSHQNWEFIGIANSNALAFGTQRVDESRFENMDLSGTMHASGGNVLYTNCTLGYITANFNGHAFNCLLADTIVVKADVDIEFVRCQSDVGGNKTPTIDLSGGSSVVQVRGYYGGIRIMGGSSNDTISVETDGQVIISANNTSLSITLRGMMSVTDSGTATNLTEDGVFNRTDVPPLFADSVWLADFEAHDGTAGSFGDSAQAWSGSAAATWTSAQRDSVLRNMEDRALSLAKLDSTLIAILTEGVWLDAAAANTNSTVGIDGTITKPVSTLAAARILADSQSLQQYYLINNSSFTLDATYENWTFLGIGRGNSINFGSQDTDNSDFYNLMITGTQGGTGVVLLDKCYLNTPDSLEALVTASSLSDTISLRVSKNTVFDQCYSHISGNTSPGLDFNSGDTIEVDIRHNSGGFTFLNMTSAHTVSIETDGQLVIDASCTGGYVTARGNMSITRNGTTTLLTDGAVFNINAVAAYPEYVYKMVATGTPTTISLPVSYINPSPNSPGDDFLLGMLLIPQGGNANKEVRIVADFAIAGSTFTVRPGFASAPNSGDTIFVLPVRGAVEPSLWTQFELDITGGGNAGVDFSNINGTLDASEIGADAITSSELATSAVNKISDGVWDKDTTDAFAVAAGVGKFVKDSTQGAAGGLTAEGVKNAVWGQVADSAFAAGTMGDSAKGWGATGAGGDGNRLCSLLVVNADGALSSGSVRMTSGADSYSPNISGDGFAVFNLNDATWTGLAYVTGNTQDTIPQTFVVTAAFKDTITMSAQSVTGASSPDMCNAYLWVFDIVGDTVENVKLTAEINGNGPWFATDDSAAIIIPKRISAMSADSGYVFVPLWRSAEVIDAAGNNPTYNFTLEKSNYFIWKVEDRTVPDTALYNIK